MKSNRREFIQSIGVGAAGLGLASPLTFSACTKAEPTKENDGQVLFIGDNIAVTETTSGKVRGYILRDIYYFLGIPYGADTSGKNRFMPPQKPEPWTDVYPAIWWGNSAPQDLTNRWRNKENTFRGHWYFDDVSENCLAVDVYTPGINDNKKRPVIVWLHSGGFSAGNSHEQEAYWGENFARFGDVVFCAPNHRLNTFGYSDLSLVGGEKYAASGNVGLLDIVAALEWVHDNIENFGGDPGNVTIIGQSGGAAKVLAITSMPLAKGLVHKAVALSGANPILMDKELTRRVGAYILKEAGLNGFQIDELQKISWKEYYKMAMIAGDKLVKDVGSHLEGKRIFQPNIDGIILPNHPYYPKAPATAAEIPMILCSTTNENSPSWRDPSLESISLMGVKDKLRGTYGEKTDEIVDAYVKAFPDKKPVEIWSFVTTHRQRHVMVADVKSKQASPVYMAWFGWQPPLLDNRMRAFHMLDICFWFYNTDIMLSYTGGGIQPRELSEKMAGYLVQFMKTGNPNTAGLPNWPQYTSEKGELMFLDNVCEVQNDPDREARKTLPPYLGY